MYLCSMYLFLIPFLFLYVESGTMEQESGRDKCDGEFSGVPVIRSGQDMMWNWNGNVLFLSADGESGTGTKKRPRISEETHGRKADY